MPAPISVIIPTLNAEAVLPRCLESLMEGLEAGLIRELVISDGGSSDATGALAQAWGAEVVQGAATRGGQLRRGCAAAKGDWLLVLHADSRLSSGWADAAANALGAADQAHWFQLRFDHGGLPARIVAGWANLRSRMGLPYGDQGLLISKTLYDAHGGYQDIPLMEDVALARALKGRLAGLEVQVTTSAEKYRRQGWLRRGGRNLWTLLRYFSGADPETLAAAYRR
ncbi:TIGR04283 family arsenosugar biosynthesis glycosyltransferase [Sulfitobacter mediterraneus]|uniref:TIGR04283 family arsenosugar biosynthesis glycosyltransferase n=1 Tax=Sulfitobacter mediterraneus TaxID=83219 RepID=UPI001932F637|nr:TIGR04283 family arsenosugar biosynthesis glycosyltransferase [Sulfitobacter mediterraneus]MBM1631366.1 TIGR04283 family arsenosugar biosynthesis glycosyltransferase [Sulfitobacter mediterraneus]MBM1639181.1 TIGR04283 family arsenosugar biosynthesis glycosyltransferase [Sulfitobacter mediterraneus]MBM1643230.1 TIGR04283 family arsenosugar biosynthesis glycosyltransferase [Sulfitobacter mediterraneus]MBM1647276.1 TIGR04283 family arsenosugar biosynthesis glycosyltransferase [Sulfitobacter med